MLKDMYPTSAPPPPPILIYVLKKKKQFTKSSIEVIIWKFCFQVIKYSLKRSISPHAIFVSWS